MEFMIRAGLPDDQIQVGIGIGIAHVLILPDIVDAYAKRGHNDVAAVQARVMEQLAILLEINTVSRRRLKIAQLDFLEAFWEQLLQMLRDDQIESAFTGFGLVAKAKGNEGTRLIVTLLDVGKPFKGAVVIAGRFEKLGFGLQSRKRINLTGKVRFLPGSVGETFLQVIMDQPS